MELHHLRYFIKVAETLHFTKAADALYVTQPALSQQIRQLEDELGVPLFYRTGRKVQLTQAGEIFLGFARAAVMSVEKGERAMSDLQHVVQGNIRMGVMYTYFAPLVDLLSDFCSRYPEVSLSIYYGNNEEIKSKLLDSQLDIALTFGADMRNDFETLGTFEAFLRVVVGKEHALARKKVVSIAELKDSLLVFPTEENIVRATMNRLFEANGIHPFINTEINDVHLLLDLVGKGKYASVMTDTATFARKDLVLIPLQEEVPPVKGVIMVKKGAFISKAAHLLLDQVLDIFKAVGR